MYCITAVSPKLKCLRLLFLCSAANSPFANVSYTRICLREAKLNLLDYTPGKSNLEIYCLSLSIYLLLFLFKLFYYKVYLFSNKTLTKIILIAHSFITIFLIKYHSYQYQYHFYFDFNLHLNIWFYFFVPFFVVVF